MGWSIEFPVSGVEVNPLLPLLAAFVVSAITTPAGVSGAFLLLPFQVSVLGFTSPGVSPTNLIYNVIATPGGIYRYARERRIVWPLAFAILLGALPGVFAGAFLRTTVFSDPGVFKFFVGLVLLYLGLRLLYQSYGSLRGTRASGSSADGEREGLATGVGAVTSSPGRVRYEFGGREFSFGTGAVLLLSFAVGVVGGIYSIGGGAIIAPFLVSIFGLPVYTVAGAALVGTFVTSVAGVAFFELFSAALPGAPAASPDWLLGAVLGVGGLAGTYAGALVQRFLSELLIRTVLGGLVTLLALSYLTGLLGP